MRGARGALVLAALLPAALQAQAPVRLASAEVALWPEYDRPSMLVIQRLVLDETVALPAALVVTIPASAGVPNAVAARVDDGLMNLAYERVVSGEVAQLRFVASSAAVQVEYYDTGLVRDGVRRSYAFAWPADYAVSSLDIVVQHPVGASDVVIEPQAGPPEVGRDSLRYQRLALGSVAVGDMRSIALRYERQQDTVTTELLPPPVAGPAPATVAPAPTISPSGATPANLVIMIVLALGIAGLMIGLLLRRRTGTAADGRTPGMRGATFCTRCGQPGRHDDRFCGKCGARLEQG